MTESTTAIATVEHAGAITTQQDLGISVEEIIQRVNKIREVRDRVMKPSVHYGKIPGVKKESLFKPGAETLCMAFQLMPKFHIVERWDGEHLECVVTCTLIHAQTGVERGDGIGSCSTRESKYAYRAGERTCPDCGAGTIFKSKQKPVFFCWAKKGGCGAEFPLNDERITSQQLGRQANPDLADTYNTIRKMGCKRAFVAATLLVTGASELFTQDVEDLPQNQRRVELHPEDEDQRQWGEERPAPKAATTTAARPVAQASAPQTEADLVNALAEIQAIETLEGLAAHVRANRGKRWSKEQIAELQAANEKRRVQLMNASREASREEDERDGVNPDSTDEALRDLEGAAP